MVIEFTGQCRLINSSNVINAHQVYTKLGVHFYIFYNILLIRRKKILCSVKNGLTYEVAHPPK